MFGEGLVGRYECCGVVQGCVGQATTRSAKPSPDRALGPFRTSSPRAPTLCSDFTCTLRIVSTLFLHPYFNPTWLPTTSNGSQIAEYSAPQVGRWLRRISGGGRLPWFDRFLHLLLYTPFRIFPFNLKPRRDLIWYVIFTRDFPYCRQAYNQYVRERRRISDRTPGSKDRPSRRRLACGCMHC